MSEIPRRFHANSFDTAAVNALNERSQLILRDAQIKLLPQRGTAIDTWDKLYAKEVEHNDLAITGYSFDTDGVSERTFLVLDFDDETATLATPELIQKEPQRLITRRLAQQLASVPVEALVRLETDTSDINWIVARSKELF